MQQASPIILLQLTDIHILPEGQLLSGVVDTGATFLRALNRIHNLSVLPQALVITGDLVEDGRPESYAYLAKLMKSCEIPYYIMTGNHDKRANMLKAFPDMKLSSRLAHTNFIQYYVDIAGVRLIALDTLVEGENHGALCQERLSWLEETLAINPDMPTIIAMHHPPFDTGMLFMDKAKLMVGADELEEIVRQNPQVQRIICGHQHRACVQSFGGTIAIVAASASHQLDLQLAPEDQLGYTCEQPLGSMHLWNEDNPKVASHLICLSGAPNPVLFSAK